MEISLVEEIATREVTLDKSQDALSNIERKDTHKELSNLLKFYQMIKSEYKRHEDLFIASWTFIYS